MGVRRVSDRVVGKAAERQQKGRAAGKGSEYTTVERAVVRAAERAVNTQQWKGASGTASWRRPAERHAEKGQRRPDLYAAVLLAAVNETNL